MGANYETGEWGAPHLHYASLPCRTPSSHWAELGFEHFKSGVWVLDLGAMTFQERMNGLLASLR